MNVDLEDVIEQWLSIFEAQLPAKLSAVDARKTYQLTSPAPVMWYFGDAQTANVVYPCVIVTSDTTREVTSEIGFRQQTYNLIVEAYATGDDVQNLSRIMRRYGAALDDTIRANNALSGYWRNVANINSDYTDPLLKADGGLAQGLRVSFDCSMITN